MNEEEFKAVQKERPLDIRCALDHHALVSRYLVIREDAECDEADEADEPADETWLRGDQIHVGCGPMAKQDDIMCLTANHSAWLFQR